MTQSYNRYLIIVILGALSTINPFAIDMYLPAFPEIATAFNTTTARISLSIASYFAGTAAGQLFYWFSKLMRLRHSLHCYATLGCLLAPAALAQDTAPMETNSRPSSFLQRLDSENIVLP